MSKPADQLSTEEIVDELHELQRRQAALEAEYSRRLDAAGRPYRDAVKRLRVADR